MSFRFTDQNWSNLSEAEIFLTMKVVMMIQSQTQTHTHMVTGTDTQVETQIHK